MAIAFDTSASATAVQNPSVNITAAEANELAVIFTVSTFEQNPTGATVDGNAATQSGSTFTWETNREIAVFFFANPPTSSVAYAVTTDSSSQCDMFVVLLKGASQGALDSQATGSDLVDDDITLTTTVVAANSWLASVVIAVGAGSNGQTAGTGTTKREEIFSAASGDSNATVGTGSQSMSWDGNRLQAGGIIVSIAPVAAAFTPRVMIY